MVTNEFWLAVALAKMPAVGRRIAVLNRRACLIVLPVKAAHD
jgi:hypothetical protein